MERTGKDPHVLHRLFARGLEMICLVYVVGGISGVWFFWFLFSELRTEPRALCFLGRHSTTD